MRYAIQNTSSGETHKGRYTDIKQAYRDKIAMERVLGINGDAEDTLQVVEVAD